MIVEIEKTESSILVRGIRLTAGVFYVWVNGILVHSEVYFEEVIILGYNP